MSDFFTKKQRKFWCDKCRIFIEYSKLVIEQHNKSKNHQKMLNSDQSYQNMKNKIAKHNFFNYDVDNDNSRNSLLKNKTGRDEGSGYEYSSGYGQDNSAPITNANTNFKSSSVENNYTSSNSFLEEVKKDTMKKMLKDKYNISSLDKNERAWGEYLDPNSGRYYYYNFTTRVSQWEKPSDSDGPVLLNEEDKGNNKTINSNPVNQSDKHQINDNKKKEGVIGKWETVDKSESVFETNKIRGLNNDYTPGVITLKEYEKLQNGEDLDDSNSESESIQQIMKKNKGMTGIDKYILEDKCENDDDNNIIEEDNELSKEDILELNKKLRRRDYDLRYVSQTYIEKNDLIKEENLTPDGTEIKAKVLVTFNQKKKNEKIISSVFQNDDH